MAGDNFPKKVRNVHFIGIGGIGVSAIARMMLAEGKRVSGSDASDSLVSRELKKLGVKIYEGHNAKNIAGCRVSGKADLVVHTTAIAEDNPELKKARELKIPILSYPEALGLVSKDKYTVAVSGTHGKTTVTAILAEILTGAKLSPSVIVGSLLKKEKSNFIAGKGDLFVCEACEYKRAFLNLTPKILVVTNIDKDHLDYYKDLKDIQSAFSELAGKLAKEDFLVCNPNGENLKPIVKKTKAKIIDCSKIPVNFKLKVPGAHNVENARLALATAAILGVEKREAAKTLERFSGVWRRFEYKGKTKNGALIYDDYAHHPTEIKAALKGAREFFGDKKICVVFQPHLYSRTKSLLGDFAKSFGDADAVIVADIYAAREKDSGEIHSRDLVAKMRHPNAFHMKSFGQIEKFLKNKVKGGDVVITMGAGDIFKVGENMLNSSGGRGARVGQTLSDGIK